MLLFFFFLGSRSFTPSNFKPSKTQICQDPKPNHNSRSVVANNPTPQNHQTSPRKSNFVTAQPIRSWSDQTRKTGAEKQKPPIIQKIFRWRISISPQAFSKKKKILGRSRRKKKKQKKKLSLNAIRRAAAAAAWCRSLIFLCVSVSVSVSVFLSPLTSTWQISKGLCQAGLADDGIMQNPWWCSTPKMGKSKNHDLLDAAASHTQSLSWMAPNPITLLLQWSNHMMICLMHHTVCHLLNGPSAWCIIQPDSWMIQTHDDLLDASCDPILEWSNHMMISLMHHTT